MVGFVFVMGAAGLVFVLYMWSVFGQALGIMSSGWWAVLLAVVELAWLVFIGWLMDEVHYW